MTAANRSCPRCKIAVAVRVLRNGDEAYFCSACNQIVAVEESVLIDAVAETVIPVTRQMMTAAPLNTSQIEITPLSPSIRIESVSSGPGMSSELAATVGFEIRTTAELPFIPGYEILGELGRGGMGVVYKARQVGLDRHVALKMILAGGHAGEQALARFRTEAEAIALLQHPNIVQIYAIGEHDGVPFFSLEFCGGGSLNKKTRGTPLPAREAARLAETLARATHAAHLAHVIHRDLKPANVLLTADGTAKITDFGLAKKLDDAGQTQTGQIMGTPSYMAPEQARGESSDVGPAADIYALGAMLYEFLTGRPPFKAATTIETLQQVVSSEAVPVRQLQPKTPRDLETICLKCLQKAPERRYASALELAEDLNRYQVGTPIRARPVNLLEHGLRLVRRNPVVAGLIVALIIALTTGLVVSNILLIEARSAKDTADKKTDAAQTAERQADRQAKQARRQAYNATMLLTQNAWEENGFAKLQELLERQRPKGDEEDLRGFEWHYWMTRFKRRKLLLHQDQVFCAAGNSDWTRVATGGNDGKVHMWDVLASEVKFSLDAHVGPVYSVKFSPDGAQFVTAGKDHLAIVWDVTTGAKKLTLTGHSNVVLAVDYSPDGKFLATASDDRTVKLWNAANGKELLSSHGHEGPVYAVTFSADGQRLASGSWDQTAKVWSATTGMELLSLKGHADWVRAVSFSPDGRRLATGSWDSTARIWDTATGEVVFDLKGHRGKVHSVAFSPDGGRVASASSDGTVKIWNSSTGAETFVIEGHTGPINTVMFTSDGQRVLTASADRSARISDATKTPDQIILTGHQGGVMGVAFSPDGKRLATASADSTIKLWDAATGDVISTLHGHENAVRDVLFNLDGTRLITAGDTSIKVWDALTGAELSTISYHTSPVSSLALSRNGKRLISGSYDGTAKIWDMDSGQECLSLYGHSGRIMAVAFSPDGTNVATASADKTVTIWEATTGNVVLTLALPDFATGIAFSPRGDRLAATTDVSVKVWDLPAGHECFTFKGHTLWTNCVAFTPDGKRLASAGDDKIIKVLDSATGEELLTLKGHSDEISRIAFSPDGKRLASASRDKTVRIWDADSGDASPKK